MFFLNSFSGFNNVAAPVGFPAGLPVWARYKADAQAEANAASITQLTDQSGNARHGTQATSGLRAIMRTGAVNGKKAFDFSVTSGNQRYYSLPSMAALTEGEIFYILKCDANDQPDGFISGLAQMGTAMDNSHYEYPNDTIYEHFGLSARVSATYSPFSTAVYHCYNASVNATTYRIFQNNVSRLNDTLTSLGVSLSFPSAPILGGNKGGAYETGFAGRMAEIVICSTKLTTAERISLHAYFNYEYALSIS